MKKLIPFFIVFLLILLIWPFYNYRILIILLLLACLIKIYIDAINIYKIEKIHDNSYNIIIKESNHRIKNNIGILTNIIDLKKFIYDDPQVIELLDDLRNKMVLISKIHEKIYESCDTKNILIKSYIEDVLKTTNNFYDNSINISYDIEDCLIKSKLAVDIVLIIQEFFTNAVKYAYSENMEDKKFSIYFKKLNDFEYLIEMSDNGIGFDNLNLSQASNFGLKIVQTIINQYKGKIELSNNNGAEIKIYLTASI